MADAHASVVDLSLLNREALEALVVAQQEKLLTRNSEIEHLKLIIAKLRRMMFGTKSEKIAREVEQLELKLEELETGEAARPPAAAPTGSTSTPGRKRKRRPLPEHLPRETHTHMPAGEACSACGGGLSKLGEDVSEMLEYIPASFKVIRHVRPKMCCTRCDTIMQAPAPSRPIDRGLPDPACWPMFWCRSMQIIFPCIASRRSMLAKESTWIDRRWPIGWELPAIYSRLWSINYASMCSPLRSYTPMTHPFQCWLPAQARPKPRASGPMCATIDQRAVMCRQLSGSPTHRIVRENIPSSI